MNNLLAQVNIGDVFELNNNPVSGIGRSPFYTTPSLLISALIKNAYMVSGLILLGLLLFGGLTYIINVGSGDAKKTAQGAKSIRSALIGFLVVFASYWIIQIIQAIFSINILNNPILP